MLKNIFITEVEINQYFNEIEILKNYRSSQHVVNYIEHFLDNKIQRFCIITKFYRVSIHKAECDFFYL